MAFETLENDYYITEIIRICTECTVIDSHCIPNFAHAVEL